MGSSEKVPSGQCNDCNGFGREAPFPPLTAAPGPTRWTFRFARCFLTANHAGTAGTFGNSQSLIVLTRQASEPDASCHCPVLRPGSKRQRSTPFTGPRPLCDVRSEKVPSGQCYCCTESFKNVLIRKFYCTDGRRRLSAKVHSSHIHIFSPFFP